MTCANPKCGRPSPDPLCWDCTKELGQLLAQIPWLYAQLHHPMPRLDNGATRPHHAPLPYNPHTREFAQQLDNELVRIARDLEESRRLDDKAIGDARTIARWLHNHVIELRLLDSAGETYVDITRAVERAVALINRPEPPLYRGPCPAIIGVDRRGRSLRCDVGLYAERGQTWIECAACHTSHDAAKLEQRHLADIGHMVFGLNDLLRVMRELGEPIARQTLLDWRTAGRIKVAGWRRSDGTVSAHWIHRDDPPMYRLADVRRVRADSKAATTRGRPA